MNIFIKTSSILLLALTLFVAVPVFAAEIFLEPGKNPGQEDQFKVDVFLSTEEQLNAIEGTLHFPPNFLELKSVDDGNSIVNFWVEHPNVIQNGNIRFSGITPGGYKGSRGLIFSITFKVLQEGKGVFDIRDARVLQNDGRGTEAKLQIIDSPFIISKKTVVFQVPVSETKDIDSPESFVPEIARDSTIFDGKWFLVFSTQDKGSGIDHYEVREGEWGWFRVSESPYLLKHQSLDRKIFVKAIDKVGNERIAILNAQHQAPWYRQYAVLVILLVMVLVGFLLKKLWPKFIK